MRGGLRGRNKRVDGAVVAVSVSFVTSRGDNFQICPLIKISMK